MAEECSCCLESKASSQFKKFATCATKPCNMVCNFCWTQYLKTYSMEHPTEGLVCFTCNVPLDKAKVFQLLLRSPDDRAYYEYCLQRSLAKKSGDRECLYADCKNLRVDWAEHSRTSFCDRCQRQACISCNAPEHLDESCEHHQIRMSNEHSQEESATAKALAQGYSAREEVGDNGRVQLRPKRPLPCPSCGIWIERVGACFRIRCPVCNLDFCGECAAPYLGRMSVPLKGNRAHHETCHYRKRKYEDRRFRPVLRRSGHPISTSEEYRNHDEMVKDESEDIGGVDGDQRIEPESLATMPMQSTEERQLIRGRTESSSLQT